MQNMLINIKDMAQVNGIKICIKGGQKGLAEAGEPGPVGVWLVGRSPAEANCLAPGRYRGPVGPRPALNITSQNASHPAIRPQQVYNSTSINSKTQIYNYNTSLTNQNI